MHLVPVNHLWYHGKIKLYEGESPHYINGIRDAVRRLPVDLLAMLPAEPTDEEEFYDILDKLNPIALLDLDAPTFRISSEPRSMSEQAR